MVLLNSSIDPSIWNSFAKERVFYRFEWLNVIKNIYKLEPYFVLCYENDKFALIASFKINKSYISMPFVSYSGFLFNDENKLNELKHYLYINNIALDSRDLIEIQEIDKFRYLNPILELDTIDSFLSSLSKKTRYQFRKAENNDLNFSSENSINNFYKIYAEGMRNLGTPLHGINYFKELKKYFPIEVFTIYEERVAIGSMFCLSDKNILCILNAYTKPEFSKEYANYFLYLNVIRWAINNNFKYLDMGRSAYDSGTFHFKKKFKPKFYAIKSNTDYSSNKKLRILSEIWKKLPLPIANYIGPKVRRFLP